jgi:predicted hotdog family 3-hydroxylacyl-ACP dehydratase
MSALGMIPELSAMSLTHAEITRVIPHAGRMALLDEVVAFSDTSLRARSGSHRLPDHPLRRDGRLSSSAGVEYAAQAAAVHGALVAFREAGRRAGFLAMLRDVRWTVERLDDITADLDIRVQLVTSQTDSVMYDFVIGEADSTLLTGRLAVFFPGAGPAP